MNEYKSCLINKRCIPCQGGVPPLTSKEIEGLLHELKDEWVINNEGHLYKEYKYSNFIDAINFANRVAKVAEEEVHHPDLRISWGLCAIEIWTHKIGGLTESDFILAAKIDAIDA